MPSFLFSNAAYSWVMKSCWMSYGVNGNTKLEGGFSFSSIITPSNFFSLDIMSPHSPDLINNEFSSVRNDKTTFGSKEWQRKNNDNYLRIVA